MDCRKEPETKIFHPGLVKLPSNFRKMAAFNWLPDFRSNAPLVLFMIPMPEPGSSLQRVGEHRAKNLGTRLEVYMLTLRVQLPSFLNEPVTFKINKTPILFLSFLCTCSMFSEIFSQIFQNIQIEILNNT